MSELLRFFSQNPGAFIIVASILITLAGVVLLIFIDAYLDGREITFWPPKIGKKDFSSYNEKDKDLYSNKNTRDLSKYRALTIPKNVVANLNRTDINLSPHALSDCSLLGLSVELIKGFIQEETSRHSILFTAPFSSMPFIYSKNIIFLSWDGSEAIVERILLSRDEAYPASDSWFKCASLYRQATAFSYRFQKQKAIIHDSEVSQIINTYKKLLQSIDNFVSINTIDTSNISLLNTLFDDAEFALYKGNQDVGIVHLEALLSSIHKFLISHAPQAPSTTSTTQNKSNTLTPKPIGEGEKAILIIEDDQETRYMISSLLLEEGYRVATSENGETALKAIVENNYELIITDIMMPKLNGYEVITGSRIICPQTKLLVITVLSEATIRKISSLNENTSCLYKPFNAIELLDLVEKLTTN